MKTIYKMSYINKMAKQMDEILGEDKRKVLLRECENLNSKDKKEIRASKMKDVITKMEDLLNESDIIKIREGCACKPSKFNKIISEIKFSTDNNSERLEKLENTNIAGRVIKITEKKLKVEFRTDKCYCGMVGSSEEVIPISWCHCCKAHIKWVYERVLESDIEPNLISSVISGGDDCVFELKVH